MDATMTITIKVAGRQAIQQLQQVQSQISQVGNGASKAGGQSKQFSSFFDLLSSNKMITGARNLQYVGRQLTYAFTLPLAAAGVSLFKTNIAIESAMQQVIKVYGDGTKSAAEYKGELDSLSKTFELLSETFGVHEEDVVNIAADYAAAGAAGSALAKDVQATLQIMTVGNIDAASATQDLIAVQAAWGLSTKTAADGTSELTNALGILNSVDIQTGVKLDGLFEALTKAGGAGRVAGASIRDVAAFTAALTPAAGTAAQAGNALKTIFSTLSGKPTKSVIEALKLIGITAGSPAWLGKTVTDKITTIAGKFSTLSSANQALIASTIAGKFQFNRFAVLMNDIASGTGYYAKALEATSSQVKINAQYQKELNDILSSNPKKWDIMKNIIRDTMANAFIPLMPLIFNIMQGIVKLTMWFSNLSDSSKSLILMALLFLAVLGPLLQVIAAMKILIGLTQVTAKWMSQLVTGFAKFLAGIAKGIVKLFGWVAGLGTGATETAVSVGAAADAVIAETGAVTAETVALADEAVAASAAAGEAAVTATGYVLTDIKVMTAEASTSMEVMLADAASAMAGLPVLALESGAAIAGAIETSGVEMGAAAAGAGAEIEAGLTLPVWAVPALIAAALAAATIVIIKFHDQIWKIIKSIGQSFIDLNPIVAYALAFIIGGPVTGFVVGFIEFHDSIWNVLKSIAKGFQALPDVIVNVFNSIVRFFQNVIAKIVDFLSYLNPFARHSPSLVDNVKAGVATILDQYAQFNKIPALIGGAMNALDAFNQVAGGDTKTISAQKDIATISKYDASGAAAAASLIPYISQLEASLPALTQEIATQQRVVDSWQNALDAANKQLKTQQDLLDGLKDKQSALGSQLDAAKSKIADYASAPLVGMKAFDDQIFANTEQQKALNLQLLKFKQAGISIDSINDKYAALNGEILLLQGQQKTLRLAGAGSDILGGYDTQIGALQQQQGVLSDTEKQINDIQTQLDQLDTAEQILQLTKDITFDPLVKQIDDLANGSKEITFDDAIAGIKEQQALIAQLQPQYDAVTAQIDTQTQAVKDAETARDKISDQLDVEQTKLGDLQDAYSGIKDTIDGIVSAIGDYATAVKEAADAKSSTDVLGDTFAAGANANFPDQGGTGTLGAEGNQADIDALNKQLQDALTASFKNFKFDFDPLKPLKDKWDDFVNWWKMVAWPRVQAVWEGFVSWVKDHWVKILVAAFLVIPALLLGPFVLAFLGIKAFVERYGSTIWNSFKTYVLDPILSAWNWLWAEVSTLWDNYGRPIIDGVMKYLVGPLVDAWNSVTSALSTAWDSVMTAISTAWGTIQGAFDAGVTFVSGVISTLQSAVETAWQAIQTAFDTASGVVSAVMAAIGGFISDAWNKVISPIWDFIHESIINRLIPVFQLFQAVVEIVFVLIGRAISDAWDLVKGLFEDWVQFMTMTFEVAWKVLQTVVETVWNAIWIAISKVWGWINTLFTTITNVVEGAFSIVWTVLQGTIETVWNKIYLAVSGAWSFIEPILTTIAQVVGGAFSLAWTVLQGTLETVWSHVYLAVSRAWSFIKPILDAISTFIGGAFSDIWGALEKTVRGTWHGILFAIGWVWDKIAGVIEGGVNFLISAFNTVASGVNGIAGALSIDVHVDSISPISIPRLDYNEEIPGAETGGIVPGRGGKFAGARAIIGEGSKVWPEYVIPTHPKYRRNAKALYNDLGKKVPMYEGGGITGGTVDSTGEDVTGWSLGADVGGGPFDSFWNDTIGKIASGANAAANAIKEGALKAIWEPLKLAASGAVDAIPVDFLQKVGKGMIQTVDDWVSGSDNVIGELVQSQGIPHEAGSWHAVIDLLNSKNIAFQDISDFRPGAITRVSHKQSYHALNRAVDITGPEGQTQNHGAQVTMLHIAKTIHDGLLGQLSELIYGGVPDMWSGAGYSNVENGHDHVYAKAYTDEHLNHVHAALANGGRFTIPRRTGGTNLLVGEGRGSEQMQVLPIRGDGEGRSVTITIDNLVLPGITNEHDAEGLLSNLEALATRKAG